MSIKNKDISSENSINCNKKRKSNIANSESEKQVSESSKKNKNLNALEKLYAFTDKYRNKVEGAPWTHSMVSYPFGSYNIPDDQNTTFFKLYEDAIVAGFETHITERHRAYGPIVIDLDFVYSKNDAGRHYTIKTIQNIIHLYNRAIKKYVCVSHSSFYAYVMEKDKPRLTSGEYHDGLHIVYPYICTKPSLQMLIRGEFIKQANKYNIFKNIPLSNDIEKVIDKQVIFNSGWLLYGSKKNSASSVYKVTHIYNSAHGKLFDTIMPINKETRRSTIHHYINELSIRKYTSESDLSPIIDIETTDEHVNKLCEKISKSGSKEEIIKLMGTDINFIKAVSEEFLVEAKNLVQLFSKDRATEWHSWYQVGRCLHNIDHRLLVDWIKFSKKCPNKFKKGECETLWKRMKPSNYTMATLHYFASNDNPKKYMKMKEEKINKLIKDGLEASHNTIAKLLMEKYKYIYRCASIKHNTWYEFKDHRWVEIDSAYSLRNLISDELTVEYARYQSLLYDKLKDKVGYDKEKCLNQAGYIQKVIKKLNDSGFKNGVIRECCDIAYDPKFLKNLDENIYLICFDNGVYDLENHIFRDGCPDDYISLTTGYKYIEYDEKDTASIEIIEFLKKIQTDNVMREYLMTLLSTCLAGSIKEENFYVFTGSGANGKSKLMELLKYTLGDYFKPMDIRLLTEKRSTSSSASPEVADKKGIRACPFDEPKATDEINTGFMKIFTGGDMITARALFKEPIYFKPQFKPFLLCNHLPSIKTDDDGTWRRLKVIPFLSKFIKKSEMTKQMKTHGLGENQFWADSSLSERLPEWKQCFMGMLIKYFSKYQHEGLVHPKLVTQHTEEYRKRCDVFQDFIGDYLEKTNNVTDSIATISLHDGMRSWYRANYEGKCPNTKDLRTYLKNRFDAFNQTTDCLTGYRVKIIENEDAFTELDDIGK